MHPTCALRLGGALSPDGLDRLVDLLVDLAPDTRDGRMDAAEVRAALRDRAAPWPFVFEAMEDGAPPESLLRFCRTHGLLWAWRVDAPHAHVSHVHLFPAGSGPDQRVCLPYLPDVHALALSSRDATVDSLETIQRWQAWLDGLRVVEMRPHPA